MKVTKEAADLRIGYVIELILGGLVAKPTDRRVITEIDLQHGIITISDSNGGSFTNYHYWGKNEPFKILEEQDLKTMPLLDIKNLRDKVVNYVSGHPKAKAALDAQTERQQLAGEPLPPLFAVADAMEAEQAALAAGTTAPASAEGSTPVDPTAAKVEPGATPAEPSALPVGDFDEEDVVTFRPGKAPRQRFRSKERIRVSKIPSLTEADMDEDAKKLDAYPIWKAKLIKNGVTMTTHKVGHLLEEIDQEDNQAAKDVLIAQLSKEQPTGVFYQVFDWKSLADKPSVQTKEKIIRFLKKAYGLADKQIRADDDRGVFITPLEFPEDGGMNIRPSFSPLQILTEEIQKHPLLDGLKWAKSDKGPVTQDVFAPKFVAEENNEYHVAYASTFIPLLKNAYPQAPELVKSIQTQEWAKKIITFKASEEGFDYSFNDGQKDSDPSVISDTLKVTQDKQVASSARDTVLDAAVENIYRSYQADRISWEHGIEIKAPKDINFLKYAAAFDALEEIKLAGIKLDEDTQLRKEELLANPDNLEIFNKAKEGFRKRKEQKAEAPAPKNGTVHGKKSVEKPQPADENGGATAPEQKGGGTPGTGGGTPGADGPA